MVMSIDDNPRKPIRYYAISGNVKGKYPEVLVTSYGGKIAEQKPTGKVYDSWSSANKGLKERNTKENLAKLSSVTLDEPPMSLPKAETQEEFDYQRKLQYVRALHEVNKLDAKDADAGRSKAWKTRYAKYGKSGRSK